MSWFSRAAGAAAAAASSAAASATANTDGASSLVRGLVSKAAAGVAAQAAQAQRRPSKEMLPAPTGAAAALLNAAKQGDVDTLRRLARPPEGAGDGDEDDDTPASLMADPTGPECRDQDGRNCLHLAAMMGQMAAVKWAVTEAGLAAATTNLRGANALHHAVFAGHTEVAKWILGHTLTSEAGAEAEAAAGTAPPSSSQGGTSLIDAADNAGRTVLHLASIQGHLEIVKWLADAGADTAKSNAEGQNCLHFAALGGKVAVVEYLVQKLGMDACAVNKNKTGALHFAMINGHINVGTWLLDNCEVAADATKSFYRKQRARVATGDLLGLGDDVGADDGSSGPDGDGDGGGTGEGESESDMKKKKSGGDSPPSCIDVNAPDGRKGWTPLFYTVLNDKPEAAAWLLSRGAEASVQDKDGMTPLLLARQAKKVKVMALLEKVCAVPTDPAGIRLGRVGMHALELHVVVPEAEAAAEGAAAPAATTAASSTRVSAQYRIGFFGAWQDGGVTTLVASSPGKSRDNGEPQAVSHVIRGLTPGQLYRIRVRLGNAHGWSGYVTKRKADAATSAVSETEGASNASSSGGGGASGTPAAAGGDAAFEVATLADPMTAAMVKDFLGHCKRGRLAELKAMEAARRKAFAWDGESDDEATSKTKKTKKKKASFAAAVDGKSHRSGLHLALLSGKLEAAKWLVSALGAKANAKSNNGSTGINFAAFGGRLNCLKWLLTEYNAAGIDDSAAVDVNAQDDAGMSPLLLAVHKGHTECVEFLLESGGDPRAVSKAGLGALHLACLGSHSSLVKKLVLHWGISPNSAAKDGATPLHLAAAKAKPSLVQWLLSHGADGKAKDKSGRGVLEFCGKENLEDVTMMLEIHHQQQQQQKEAPAPEADAAADAASSAPTPAAASAFEAAVAAAEQHEAEVEIGDAVVEEEGTKKTVPAESSSDATAEATTAAGQDETTNKKSLSSSSSSSSSEAEEQKKERAAAAPPDVQATLASFETSESRKRWSHLHFAAAAGCSATVDWLLTRDPASSFFPVSPDAISKDGLRITPAHVAAAAAGVGLADAAQSSAAAIKILGRLIEGNTSDADRLLECRDAAGWTCTHYAVSMRGHRNDAHAAKLVAWLHDRHVARQLEQQAAGGGGGGGENKVKVAPQPPIFAPDGQGCTPLMLAARAGAIAVLKWAAELPGADAAFEKADAAGKRAADYAAGAPEGEGVRAETQKTVAELVMLQKQVGAL